jgi:iron complex outermembrane receptor protein
MRLHVLLSASLCLAAFPILADDELENIIVTAERRAESIQDIPVAISAFSGETLVERNISTLADLKYIAPSVAIGGDEGPNTKVRIRGIGSFSGEEPAVAQVQDGIPYSTEGYGNLRLAPHAKSSDFFCLLDAPSGAHRSIGRISGETPR